MKKWYFIQYWDKFYRSHSTTLKAKSTQDAEKRFYNKNPYTLITKISLVD